MKAVLHTSNYTELRGIQDDCITSSGETIFDNIVEELKILIVEIKGKN